MRLYSDVKLSRRRFRYRCMAYTSTTVLAQYPTANNQLIYEYWIRI